MAKVKVFINGQKIITDSSKTILTVVHENQLDHIPNLCLEQQLEPFNSCYLCLVEVKGRPKLVPACSTKVMDKMEIFTRNQKVFEGRRTSLELLLSNHFADCLPPCTMRCPAGVDIQGYLAMIEMGKYQEAIRLIKETNPFPSVCGRVCTRPCELACRRSILDKNVGIDFLKRYAADKDLSASAGQYMPECAPLNGKRAAIVGAGPSGLSAAYYLRKAGIAPTVFEAMPDAGGMLRYGIPTYRLPFDILDREIDAILKMGVQLRTNMSLGEEFTVQSLLHEGFEAVFLAMGAWGSRSLGCTGQDADGVLSGIEFLEEVGLGREPKIHGRIVVVGGGNTAIDCARTSIRLGAKEVILLYRRTRNEMPANSMEIDAAEHEGVKMIFLSAPVEVMTEKNRVKSLRCIRMELGEPDDSGRRRPVEVPGSEYFLECDFVFAAIGQTPKVDIFSAKNTDLLPPSAKIGVTRWGTVMVNPETFETETDGVFAGGDMVSGAATAIEAIAAGRKAAHAIKTYFENGSAKPEKWHFNSRKDDFRKVESKDLRYDRKLEFNPMPELSVKERVKSFVEVETGYSDQQAHQESARCLECGCEALFDCKLREYASEYGIKIEGYKGPANEYPLDRSHPLLELDPNKCILCARCVRVCNDIAGSSVYGFTSRGFATIVRPEMGKPLIETDCISCGNCEATCPTGAIVVRDPTRKPGPWELQRTQTTCSFCSVGCSVTLGRMDQRIIKTMKGDPDSHNHGNLCAQGRFGFGFLNDQARLTQPQIKSDGSLRNVDWAEAFKVMSNHVTRIIHQHEGDATAVFISPRLTNEEIYVIQKFARIVLKTNNIGSYSMMANPGIDYLSAQSTADARDIEASDCIVMAMADLRKHHTVADFMVRKAQKSGAKIIWIGPNEQNPMSISATLIKAHAGTEFAAIQGIFKALSDQMVESGRCPEAMLATAKKLEKLNTKKITEITGVAFSELRKAAELIASAARPVFICERVFPGVRDLRDIPAFIAMANCVNAGMVIFEEHNNTRGLRQMGGIGAYFPGGRSILEPEAKDLIEKIWCASFAETPAPHDNLLAAMEKGRIKNIFIFGEDLLALKKHAKSFQNALKKAEFVMVSDLYQTKVMALADCILPMTSHVETRGTFMNSFGGSGPVRRALEPRTGLENYAVLALLAEKIGMRYKFDYQSVKDIKTEIAFLMKKLEESKSEPGYEIRTGEIKYDLNLEAVEVIPTWPANSVKNWFADFWKNLGLDRHLPGYYKD